MAQISSFRVQDDWSRQVGKSVRQSMPGCLICWLLAALPLAAAEPAPGRVTPDDYRASCRDIADRMLERVFRDPQDWIVRQRQFAAISHAALVQARLWRWTEEPRYARGADRYLRVIAEQRGTLREADFFTVYPYAKTFQILQQDGRLTGETARESQAFMEKCFRARDVADHNQALTRACGLALAAELLPDSPRATAWRQYAEDVWSYWLRIGDITENASNYNRIDAIYVFLLADLLDRHEDLRRRSVRAMFQRWRDQVSPSGAIPAYGDSGSGPLQPDPNWPRNNGWGQWVAAFERAATFYRDETFQWAAQRIYRRGMRSEPLGRRYFHALALSALTRAPQWMTLRWPDDDGRRALQAPPAGPLLQTRRDATTAAAWDKLILNPSRAAGQPFVLCELYARGHHGHANQHGGVEWFECGNVPLICSLGYNNRQPHHTNALVIQPDNSQPFPYRERYPANQWLTAELPTSRLPAPAGAPRLRHLTELGLRVESTRGVTLWIDNLRLAGPGRSEGDDPPNNGASPAGRQGKVRLLEGFESPEGWNFAPHRTGLSTQGRYGLVFQLPPGAHTAFHPDISRRLRSMVFDPEQYPRLLIDWRLSDNDEVARPFILRAGTDFHAHTAQLQPRLLEAACQGGAGDDQLGTLQYANWYGVGADYQRQLLLTREGMLLVVDRLFPSADIVGRIAGPVWHVGPRNVPVVAASGEQNQFHIRGARQELHVHLARDDTRDRQFGICSADVWSIDGQKTVYARQRLTAQPTVFVTALIPAPAGADRPAPQVAVRTAPDHVAIRLQHARGPAGTLDAKIHSNGRFSVSRK